MTSNTQPQTQQSGGDEAVAAFMKSLGAELTSMGDYRFPFPFTHPVYHGYREYVFFNDQQAAFFHQTVQAREREAEQRGMEKAKARVLRRTEIPKDAKNPTRDHIVVLGEHIADIIQQDIDKLAKPHGLEHEDFSEAAKSLDQIARDAMTTDPNTEAQ